MNPPNQNKGFTLIELMVTLAVFAILVAIAYPSYRQYIINSRRSDAKILLSDAATHEERFYTQYNTYTTTIVQTAGCTGSACGLGYATNLSPEGYYTLAVTVGPTGNINSSFLLTATPTTKGGQNNDTTCAAFTLDSTGVKASTNSSNAVTTTQCWNQ